MDNNIELSETLRQILSDVENIDEGVDSGAAIEDILFFCGNAKIRLKNVLTELDGTYNG